MASRSTPTKILAAKQLTSADMQRGIERLERRAQDLSDFDLNKIVTDDNPPEIKALALSIERSLGNIFGENTPDYNRYAAAAEVCAYFSVVTSNFPQRHHFVEDIRNRIASSRAIILQAAQGLRDDLQDQDDSKLAYKNAVVPIAPTKVFVVHGHDVGVKEATARFLEKIDLEAIILHEQPDMGQTIIEKFEKNAAGVAFAIVLLTPDDLGGTKNKPQNSERARQNVIYELGYFTGKLGRGKTLLLKKGDVEIPSDLLGVIYTEFDAANAWKMKVAQELKAAGLVFDLGKVLG